MNETVELKHSTREKWRYLLFYWALLLFMEGTNYWATSDAENAYLPFYIGCGFFFTPLQWWYQTRQLIRVNREGVYVWQWLRGRLLRWDEISDCEMAWEQKLEDFLLTSYGLDNLQGRIKLCATGARPFRFKINFDSMAQRRRLKKALMLHLHALELAQDSSQLLPFRAR